MSDTYDPELREIAEKACWKAGVTVRHGVYIAFSGPSYETPAEIRMCRALGADAVGMSTVPEAIAARHMGIRVLGLSCITNMAAGVIKKKLDHREVLEVGEKVRAAHARRAGRDHRGGREAHVSRRPRPLPPRELRELVRLARRARRRAHAPFSRFKVGAALRTRAGEIVTGCNVENASYGLTLCAERVAVFKAVSEGLRRFDAVAVVADAPAGRGALRPLPPDPLGVLRRHLGAHGEPRRTLADRAPGGAAADALRPEEPVKAAALGLALVARPRRPTAAARGGPRRLRRDRDHHGPRARRRSRTARWPSTRAASSRSGAAREIAEGLRGPRSASTPKAA